MTKPTLIYFGDPMCSWCYGFSPELSKVLEELSDTIDFEMVMGGLRPYGTQSMGELKSFLTHHWEEIGQLTNQSFKYDILDADLLYDTEPSSRAVVVARHLKPSCVLDYFKEAQYGFYAENNAPNEVATFVQIAEKFGIDGKKFQRLFESDSIKQATKKEFEYAGEMGVRGFPSLVLSVNGQGYLLSSGYTKAADIQAKIEQILKR
ncbi:MAG: DsbA family protein [Chitinophagales bacterium]